MILNVTGGTDLCLLESLTLNDDIPSNSLVEYLAGPESCLSIARLRRLATFIPTGQTPALNIQKMITLCADSLEEIKLEVGGGPFFMPQTVDLGVLHNLRHLNVELFGQTVSYLSRMCLTLPFENSIVELKISVTPGLTGTGGGTKAWHELDDLLTEDRHGPRLERVTVRTMSPWLISPPGFIAQALPKLLHRGILFIEDRFGSALGFDVGDI
ncbi:hypothetical protein C0991_009479 [Blastosporella zonata]|nr:hypothetical protein C0991_009479 [Blastosporella zonata]